MHLKKSFLIAILLSFISLSAWEIYWRSQGYHPTINDEKALWAKERAKLEDATQNDVVFLGSSRVYFDFQKKVWEKETGIKPIQLAVPGTSPLPALTDVVENTNFTGTVIIGVTPGLFFSTTYPKAPPWDRMQSNIDFYHNLTYAQKSNFFLSIPLQKNLVMMSADEEEWSDDIDLKALLRRQNTGERNGKTLAPPFYNFGDINYDRNMAMSERAATDTAFANSIIRVWNYFAGVSPPPDKEATTTYFLKDATKFLARGGKLILVRCPSSGGTRIGENKFLNRETHWDSLVNLVNAKTYHFEDYDQLKTLTCPEESHLSKKDAEFFTKELAQIMIKDNAISNLNTH